MLLILILVFAGVFLVAALVMFASGASSDPQNLISSVQKLVQASPQVPAALT